MSLFSDFSKLDFANLDSTQVEQPVVNAYERATGRTLYPGEPERLFLSTLAALLTMLISLINFVGNQQFLAHATGPHEDLIGQMVGETRLPESCAVAPLRFSLPAPLEWPVLIPEGTRANPQGDEKHTFATAETAVIEPGELSVVVSATCLIPGASGNGFLPGQINRLVDPLAYVTAVENTEVSRLGADAEDDEHFRERIQLAPEAFSCAGPEEAYRHHALSAHQGIADVGVFVPMPGTVEVRPIMQGGELPSEEVLEKVRAALSADDVRPLTDTVIVSAPEVVPYAVEGQWWLHRDNAALAASIQQKISEAEAEYRAWQCAKPGRDINPTRLIALLERAGAKRVKLASPEDVVLLPGQIAREASSSLVFMGIEDD